MKKSPIFSKKPTGLSPRPSSATSSPSKSRTRQRPEWNSYLTDADKFKSTPEKIIEKQKNLVSKNKVYDDKLSLSERSNLRVLEMKKKIATSNSNDNNNNNNSYIKSKTSTPMKRSLSSPSHHSSMSQLTSLDLITISDEEDEFDEYQLMEKSKYQSDYDEIDEQEDDLKEYIEKNFSLQKNKNKTKSIKKSSSSSTLSVTPTSNSITNKKKLNDDSTIKSISTPRIHHSPSKFSLPANEISLMAEEIRILLEELNYYEEVSGKKNILNNTDITSIFPELYSNQTDKIEPLTIMRFLVQLNCQTITHLLKSEVEKQSIKEEMIELNKKFDTLSSFVMNSLNKSTTSSIPTTNNDLQSSPSPQMQPNNVYSTPHFQTSQVQSLQPSYSKVILDNNGASTSVYLQESQLSIQSNQYTPPSTNTTSALQAMQEINERREKDSSFSKNFTGTSPTDYLFSPQINTSVENYNNKKQTNKSENVNNISSNYLSDSAFIKNYQLSHNDDDDEIEDLSLFYEATTPQKPPQFLSTSKSNSLTKTQNVYSNSELNYEENSSSINNDDIYEEMINRLVFKNSLENNPALSQVTTKNISINNKKIPVLSNISLPIPPKSYQSSTSYENEAPSLSEIHSVSLPVPMSQPPHPLHLNYH